MKMPKRKTCDPDEIEALEELMQIPTPEIFDNDGPIWVNKFTEDSARAFVKVLTYQSRRDPTAPIVIFIDSFGGEVYSLLTMIAALESVPNDIVTVAFGKAMSAGALLLACGDVRYASQYSTMMVHEMSAGTVGHVADIDIEHANIAQLNEKLLKLMAKKCKIKGGAPALKKTLEKTRDLYMSPEDAVSFGLVDKIGVPALQRKVSVEWGLMVDPRGAAQQEPDTKEKKNGAAKAKKPARKS